MTTYRKFLTGGAAFAALAFAAVAIPAPAAFAFTKESGAAIVLDASQQRGGSRDQQPRGQGSRPDSDRGGQGQGQGGRSLDDIFRDIGGEGEEEDSDRPDWAGTPGGGSDHGGGRPSMAGSKRGDLFGDLWVILRDENGVPILTPEGWVQPLDANGNPVPLDEEGAPIDETLVQEVELGRLNVGRAPNSVLDRRAEEVVTLLNAATDLSTDASGRLVITTADGTSTIDSPLENLAIYVALLTQGTIPGVSDLPGTAYDHLVDGVFTAADLQASASFLAAATDKTSPFTADEIAYINAFLGINTATRGSATWSVIDYSDFTYDRSDVYGSATATVLVQQADGTWVAQTVNIYEAVFGSVDATVSGSLDAYTRAADDARTVVNFLHEYEVPATSLDDVEH
ncbi:hypothetical protein Q0812_08685 [Brevundimonas sp. 2R-24]|uniref:SLH domain-containing protein n=1 Tax=Peiella sedimenti TaxID=3061083 RepID=A0ABT8SMB7_9CAUL|nr:hypothetical protein [Caulobacteraceae bacterium XZ-24]